MGQDLRVFILGPLVVERAGRVLPEGAWRSRQERRLLAILLARRERRVTADQLVEWLWPGADHAAAAVTLRATVSGLRRVLEPDSPRRASSRFVLTVPGGYRWNPEGGAWVDADALLALTGGVEERRARAEDRGASATQLEEAVALYRGELLEDEPDAPWALGERRRLHDRYLWAAQGLVAIRIERGDAAGAAALARRALEHAPLCEPLVRDLMRSLLLAGDAAGALEQYERYRQALDHELGAMPSPQTQALHAAILRGEPTDPPRPPAPRAPADRPPAPPPIVGRERELATLRGWLDEAARRRGGVVALVGEPGIGKTRLIGEVLAEAAARGMLTVGLRCTALERDVPFGPVGAAVGPLVRAAPEAVLRLLPASALAQAAELLPVLRDRLPDLPQPPAAPPEDLRARTTDALADLALGLARGTPLLVVCDDAQWADEATLALIGRLSRGAARRALLVVLAYRADELADSPALHALLRSLGREMLLRPLVLSRLDDDAAARLIATVGRVSSQDVADLAPRLAASSGGNPLLLTVAVQAMLEQHGAASLAPVLARLGAGVPLPDLSGAQPIRDLVLGRVERLPAAARDLAEQVAVIGRAVSLDLVEVLAGAAGLEAAQVLLEREIFAEGADGRVGFSHEIVQSIVAATLVSPRRRVLHRRAAQALVALHGEQPDRAAEVAHHLLGSGRGVDAELLRFAALAGDEARRVFAYHAAAAHYDAALAAAERLGMSAAAAPARRAFSGRALVCEALLDWDGIVATAARYDRWAAARGEPAPSPVTARRLALLRALMGDLAGAAEIASRGAPGGEPAPVLEEMLRRTSLILEPDRGARPDGRRGTGGREPGGDPLAPVASEVWQVPTFTPAAPLPGASAYDLPELLGQEAAAPALFQLGWAAVTQGLLPDAEACLARAYDLASASGQAALAALAALQLAHCAALRGNVAERDRWMALSLETARRAPEAAWASVWPEIHRGFLALQDDRPEEARAQLTRLSAALADLPALQSHRASAEVGLGLAALARGDRVEATQRLGRALDAPHLLYGFVYIAAQLGAARLAALGGDVAAARGRLAWALQYIVRRGLLPEYARAAIEVARLERDYGDPAAAVPLLREATALAERAGLAPLAGAGRALLGRLTA